MSTTTQTLEAALYVLTHATSFATKKARDGHANALAELQAAITASSSAPQPSAEGVRNAERYQCLRNRDFGFVVEQDRPGWRTTLPVGKGLDEGNRRRHGKGAGAMSGQHTPALDKADLSVLLRVYRANVQAVQLGMPVGTPFLFDGRSWRRARALCASGHLRLHDIGQAPPTESLVPVTVTQAGIDAYNAALTKAERTAP